MKSKEIANILLYGYGFNFLMTMHILRYSKEEKISIHEIIQKFKDNSVSINYVAYISYNGYESFKRLFSGLEKANAPNKMETP